VNTGVDFSLEDLLGTLDGQGSHFFAQGLAGFDDLLCGFLFGVAP